MGDYLDVEDLEVYQRLCRLHIEICAVTDNWPRRERFELASQVRRSSNSVAANLAEKNSDRHLKNKIEGVNRARGEAEETIHHLYVAVLKGLVPEPEYHRLRSGYKECVRMLNGLERSLERHLPRSERKFVSIDSRSRGDSPRTQADLNSGHRTLNTEH